MAEKSSRRRHITSIQELTLVPVTDPAEIERRVRKTVRLVEVEATPDGVLELYQGLPAEARLKALRRLVRKLSADEKRELLARLSPPTQEASAPRTKRNGRK
jgi:hypothetical protein